jgi:LAS superfamily LD-carboxypeptidase LdcB
MKKFLIFLIPSVIITIAGCSKKEEQTNTTNNTQPPVQQQTTPVPTQTEKKDTTKLVEQKKESNSKEKTNPAPYRVIFPAGETQVILNGKKTTFTEQPEYVVSGKAGQSILIRVMSKDTKSNISIDKIISPSGKVAGPYSVKMKYDIEETGDWKIVLGASNNPPDPWKGDYQILIAVN